MIRISLSSSSGIGKRLDQGAPEDRDLVGQILVRLPEPEEVGIVGILLLDYDGDVLERAGELRRQLVERPRTCSSKVTSVGVSGARTWNSAHRRGPEEEAADVGGERDAAAGTGCVSEKPPCQSWKTNQKPRNSTAESRHWQEPEEQRHDAGVGEEHEVRAEDAGDRSARADVRDARRAGVRVVQRHPGLRERGREAGGEVEDEKAERGPSRPRRCSRRSTGRACCRGCGASSRAGTSPVSVPSGQARWSDARSRAQGPLTAHG